ncbi:right-handed parallel beta-helix repeat-containing protein [Halorussus salinus]|uniref:right-handed parallel beta-helix repeat-containing protein n=1 Tax=Halorussus salinus TaxID=1364935 RepID=UPI001092FA96|nr:right-handed parallel beta-helix repeat-containing protein [Halorussus salinus]
MVSRADRVAVTVLAASVLLGLVAGAGGVAGDRPNSSGTAEPPTTSTLVVAENGSGSYESIQAAIDAASPGATVEVRPGTYDERLVIDSSITVVAPDGATLNGEVLPGEATALTISSGSGAEPVIDGLTITNYYDAVSANDTAGGWTLRNVTIRNNRNDGVIANRASGEWSIRNSTIRENADEGLEAENTTGAWTIRGTSIAKNEDDGIDVDGADTTGAWTIRNSTIRRSGDDAIDADEAQGAWMVRNTVISNNRNGIQIIDGSGDWTVADSIIRNNTGYGVYAGSGTGDWTIRHTHFLYNVVTSVHAAGTSGDWGIRNTTIRDSNVGVNANSSTGNWTISRSSIQNTSVPKFDLTGEGTGIYAPNSTGAWTVRRSNIDDNAEHAIDATGSATRGDATRNWWGAADGPSEGDCVGSVDCSASLSSSARVPDPPTIGSDADADAVSSDGGIGLLSFVVVGALAAVLITLTVLTRRYT